MNSSFLAMAISACLPASRVAARPPLRPARRATVRLGCLVVVLVAWLAAGMTPVHAAGAVKFKRVPTQFIAALGEPGASSGGGAQSWGLWVQDPGPRGVRLSQFSQLQKAAGVAPARWQFDSADWWLEENGLIMEQPHFPVPPRKYLVTGDRDVTAVLTIHPPDQSGERRWELDSNASLHDVTHLGCRAARYAPAAAAGSCSPARVRQTLFPVAPGATMPAVEGCSKQDYAVLIVIGVAVEE
jgi:hypothetical protein